jgi:disulfide bond formation protein DsbB
MKKASAATAAGKRSSGVPMPGIDKPTGRVVALIVLMIVVAAALRGYLPAPAHAVHKEAGSGRAALVFVIAALSGTVALLAIAVIARLRDPRAAAPRGGDLSELLGTGKGRPNWRVMLIGLAVIVAWLLILMLLVRLLVPPAAAPSAPTPAPTAPPSGHATGPPPQQRPQNNTGDTLRILLVSTIAMLLVIVTGSVIISRRRWRATTPATIVDDHFESPAPAPRSESLVRAAELGLAEIGDLNRDPREAIIACYAAMERELANVPGAVPQDFDTPTEVLVRAVEHHALHADNAAQLVNLFEEARFSPHVMNEGHRKMAVNVLRLVLTELRSPV